MGVVVSEREDLLQSWTFSFERASSRRKRGRVERVNRSDLEVQGLVPPQDGLARSYETSFFWSVRGRFPETRKGDLRRRTEEER